MTDSDHRNQGWYQFNDETVTKIESLAPKLDTGKKASKGSKDAKKSGRLLCVLRLADTDGIFRSPANQLPKGRPPKKCRRIGDNDSEIEIVEYVPFLADALSVPC